jgi:hypothetical protein
MTGGQEIEFQEIETGDRKYHFAKLIRRSKLLQIDQEIETVSAVNLQNCSGDRKCPRGPRGSLFQGFFYRT